MHAVKDESGAAMMVEDLKPSNCLLGRDDRLYLADSGIHQVFLHSGTSGSRHEATRDAWYKAPEQFNEEDFGAQSEKIDIWAWGCVLVEMTVGQHPWARTAPTERHPNGRTTKAPAIMRKLLSREIPEAPRGVDVAVTLCFQLAARAFKHSVAQRPSAAELLPHVQKLRDDLAARDLG